MTRKTIIEAIGPVLAYYSREQLPVAAAAAERLAAERYKYWADQVDNNEVRIDLLACANREEEIARRVDGVHDEAAELHVQIAEEHPDLRELYWSMFEGLQLAEQFGAQAAAERTGAQTWRAFAADCAGSERESVYLACALLEEQNADTLDRLIADGVGA